MIIAVLVLLNTYPVRQSQNMVFKSKETSYTITIILSDEANSFVRQQPFKAQQKIAYNIRRVQSGLIEKDVFKKLENSDIWELRTLFNGICYRLFAFWDTKKGALVVVTHGIVKKTQKTPKKEIEKAERIRKEYFNDKK